MSLEQAVQMPSGHYYVGRIVPEDEISDDTIAIAAAEIDSVLAASGVAADNYVLGLMSLGLGIIGYHDENLDTTSNPDG